MCHKSIYELKKLSVKGKYNQFTTVVLKIQILMEINDSCHMEKL